MKELFILSKISSPLEKMYQGITKFQHALAPLCVIPHLVQEICIKGKKELDSRILNICSPNLFSQPSILAILALFSFSL